MIYVAFFTFLDKVQSRRRDIVLTLGSNQSLCNTYWNTSQENCKFWMLGQPFSRYRMQSFFYVSVDFARFFPSASLASFSQKWPRSLLTPLTSLYPINIIGNERKKFPHPYHIYFCRKSCWYHMRERMSLFKYKSNRRTTHFARIVIGSLHWFTVRSSRKRDISAWLGKES